MCCVCTKGGCSQSRRRERGAIGAAKRGSSETTTRTEAAATKTTTATAAAATTTKPAKESVIQRTDGGTGVEARGAAGEARAHERGGHQRDSRRERGKGECGRPEPKYTTEQPHLQFLNFPGRNAPATFGSRQRFFAAGGLLPEADGGLR